MASDVTILINNAGSHSGARILDGDIAGIQADLQTNFLGVVLVARAFAPTLAANGGGGTAQRAVCAPGCPAATATARPRPRPWSATNALRVALRAAGTLVTGLHVGYMDTDMTAGLDVAKADPREVARQAVDALREDRTEVLADDTSRTVKRALCGDPALLYPAAA